MRSAAACRPRPRAAHPQVHLCARVKGDICGPDKHCCDVVAQPLPSTSRDSTRIGHSVKSLRCVSPPADPCAGSSALVFKRGPVILSHRAGAEKPAAETADVHMTDAEPARAKPPAADGAAAPAPQPPAPGKGAAAPEASAVAPAAPPAAAPARKEPVSEPMPDDGEDEEEDEGDSAARVEELRRIDEELAKADDRRALAPAPVVGGARRRRRSLLKRPPLGPPCWCRAALRGGAEAERVPTAAAPTAAAPELALLDAAVCCHGWLQPGSYLCLPAAAAAGARHPCALGRTGVYRAAPGCLLGCSAAHGAASRRWPWLGAADVAVQAGPRTAAGAAQGTPEYRLHWARRRGQVDDGRPNPLPHRWRGRADHPEV